MRHIPVLLSEVIEGLNLAPGSRVVDCTLGDGGHAEEIMKKIGATGKLLGIDADPESLLRSKQNLYDWHDQIMFVRENFHNLSKILNDNNFLSVDAILMDLGWSSPQFEERGRGFSFQKDEPLDMRYDTSSQVLKASQLVNYSDQRELEKIFKIYGEEKFFTEIAEAIVAARLNQPIKTTAQLAEIVLAVYRRILKTNKEIPYIGGIHPATKVFQALRIAVNDELTILKQVLPQATAALAVDGRLAVITFHSLEDRIVKQYFDKLERQSPILVQSVAVRFHKVFKKPVVASACELEHNPRARSAKLRIIQKSINS